MIYPHLEVGYQMKDGCHGRESENEVWKVCAFFQDNWKKNEKVKIGKNQTVLGQVGFLQQIQNQVHEVDHHVGIRKLVFSCFLKCGW